MEYKYNAQIKCPYCDWEDIDSWEFNEDCGLHTCGCCEEEFYVERHVEVTYSTSRIDCSTKKIEHKYKLEYLHEHKKRFTAAGKWEDLPEHEYTYHRVEKCINCGAQKYIDISKEEYKQSCLDKIPGSA